MAVMPTAMMALTTDALVRKSDKPTVAFCMGDLGTPSRILSTNRGDSGGPLVNNKGELFYNKDKIKQVAKQTLSLPNVFMKWTNSGG